jgi:DNA-binding CsgD family transcriptional regulator
MPFSKLGIIVVGRSGAIAYNTEAIHILAFPAEESWIDDAWIQQRVASSVKVPIGDPLPATGEVKSGRRRYSWLALPMHHARGGFGRSKSVLLIRRPWYMLADIELIAAHYGLTPRERQCVEYLLVGLSNKDIAERLKISRSTVNTFLHLIMVKMGANSRCSIPLKLICTLSGDKKVAAPADELAG